MLAEQPQTTDTFDSAEAQSLSLETETEEQD